MAISDDGSSGQSLEPSLSYRVVEAIAEAKGVAPTELDPLYGILDLEAMDSLDENSSVDVSLSYLVLGCDVEIRDGDVHVEVVED